MKKIETNIVQKYDQRVEVLNSSSLRFLFRLSFITFFYLISVFFFFFPVFDESSIQNKSEVSNSILTANDSDSFNSSTSFCLRYRAIIREELYNFDSSFPVNLLSIFFAPFRCMDHTGRSHFIFNSTIILFTDFSIEVYSHSFSVLLYQSSEGVAADSLQTLNDQISHFNLCSLSNRFCVFYTYAPNFWLFLLHFSLGQCIIRQGFLIIWTLVWFLLFGCQFLSLSLFFCSLLLLIFFLVFTSCSSFLLQHSVILFSSLPNSLLQSSSTILTKLSQSSQESLHLW